MKIKTLALLVLGLGLSGTAANAAHVWDNPGGWWDDHFTAPRQHQQKFAAHELSMDLFASYTAAERGIDELFDTNIEHGDWGGGVGLNYFFTRAIGIGADINMPDNGGNLVDSIGGSLIARLPTKSGFSPYIFGGGGRMTEPRWQWFYHAGVGLEIRLNPITGIFIDGRYVWADNAYSNDAPAPHGNNGKWDGDQVLFRAGIRLVF
jgi:hypothetical protein